jgi:hypothetical protein
LKILGEVQKRFLAPFTAIMEAREQKDNTEAFASAVERISKSLDGDSLVDLAKRVLNPEYISVIIDNQQPEKLEEATLNRATDNVFDVVSLIIEVLRFNYTELFTRGKALIGAVQVDTAIH